MSEYCLNRDFNMIDMIFLIKVIKENKLKSQFRQKKKGSFFFRYPDILQAQIVVTSANLPAGVVAKTSGRIDTVFVTEKQRVKTGNLLAFIENPSNLDDVLTLKEQLFNFSLDSLPRNTMVFGGEFGDLQQAVNNFQKALNDYVYFIDADYHNKKIAVIERQISVQKDIMQKTRNSIEMSLKQTESAKRLFDMDSALYEKKVISVADFETAKTVYLQSRQTYVSARLSIDNQQISILQSEQSVFDLQQQRVDQENTLKQSLTTTYDALLAQIKTWEQSYLLTSPIDGIVSLYGIWLYQSENQQYISCSD